MNLVIVSHTPHYLNHSDISAYAPYVNEVNLWADAFDEMTILAPLAEGNDSGINLAYNHRSIRLLPISNLHFKSPKRFLTSLFRTPIILWSIFRAFKNADHIHLRCPGNIGLLGCLVQIFFPRTKKTAKYAGNWDPKAKRQPLSYRLQKWILANPWLTRNMQVMVYGDWPDQSPNIKPFFTATYSAFEARQPKIKKNWCAPWRMVFAGTLSEGKNPFYAVKLVQRMRSIGLEVCLDIFGEGIQREKISTFITEHELCAHIILHGNKPPETLKQAYKEAHFLVLPSQSEGWPKVVAEGMFWGAIPLTRAISCVPWMIGDGKRGLLLQDDLDKAVQHLSEWFERSIDLERMSQNGMEWSRGYTTDRFAEAIKKLMTK